MASIVRQTVLVDKDRLYEAIESRGLSKREVSSGIGYAPDYISNCCAETTWKYTDGKPKISKIAAIALKGLYDIEQSEYEYVEPIEPIAEPEPVREPVSDVQTVKDMTGEELSNLIYKAVYSAVMHAWEGCDEQE